MLDPGDPQSKLVIPERYVNLNDALCLIERHLRVHSQIAQLREIANA